MYTYTEKAKETKMNDYDLRVRQDIQAKFHEYDQSDPIIKIIVQSNIDVAWNQYLNAGYSGARDDGGAQNTINKLQAFLDGIQYAKTGKSNVYSDLVHSATMKQDKEYEEYVRLAEKFKNV